MRKMEKKEIILMAVRGFLTLVINILLYVVLVSYILNNLNSLLRRYDLPISVLINEKDLLITLVIIIGLLISLIAAIRSAAPSDSIIKLIGIGLEILLTVVFYSIFIITGNSILLLEVNIELNAAVILDVTNIIYANFVLQLLKIGVLVFQVIEFNLLRKDNKETKQEPIEVNEQMEKMD